MRTKLQDFRGAVDSFKRQGISDIVFRTDEAEVLVQIAELAERVVTAPQDYMGFLTTDATDAWRDLGVAIAHLKRD